MTSTPSGVAPRRGRLYAELRSFVAIGIACTVAYAVIYTLLRGAGLGPLAANALALGLTMGANFAANRRYTFAATGPIASQFAGYAVAYAIGFGASELTLAFILAGLGHPHGALDTAGAVLAGLVATAVRFVLMRAWVFAPDPAPASRF